jgi:hypothetical protein
MPNAQVSLIQIYGGSPSIPPQPEVGVVHVTGATAKLGSGDGPVGEVNINVPLLGSNRSLIQAFALRVIQVASPITTLSNVRFYLNQAGKNALEGAWSDIQLLTPGPATNPLLLDPFDVAVGAGQGLALGYMEPTRVFGPQGYIGDSFETVYGFTGEVDMLADASLGLGQLDLTGLGRADGTTATFGNRVNDVSRMLLMQAALGPNVLAGPKPGVQVVFSYDENE